MKTIGFLVDLNAMLRTLILIFSFSVHFLVQAADPLDQASALLKRGEAQLALAVLLPLEADRAGVSDFDYLLGVVALEAQDPVRALIAFERLLSYEPANAGARLDSARALFALGAIDLARYEFLQVLKLNPPEAARVAAQRYLDAIALQKAAQPKPLTWYFDAIIGHDSNVSAAISPGRYANALVESYFPGSALVPGAPEGNSVKQASLFAAQTLGFQGQLKLSRQLSLFAEGDVRARQVLDERVYDINQAQLGAGALLDLGPLELKVGLSRSDLRQLGAQPGINNDARTGRASIELRRVFNAHWAGALTAQYSHNGYFTNPTQNTHQRALGFNVLYTPNRKRREDVFFLSLQHAIDRATQPTQSIDPSREQVGLRVYGQYGLAPKWQGYASVGATWRGDLVDFGRGQQNVVRGKDVTTDWLLGLNYRYSRSTTLRGQLAEISNKSNIPIAEYDKSEVSFGLRYDFK